MGCCASVQIGEATTSLTQGEVGEDVIGEAVLTQRLPKVDELNVTARNKLKSAQHHPSLVAACWVQAGLW